MSLPKEDAILILKQRQIAKTGSQLDHANSLELNSLLGSLSLDEQNSIQRAREKRSPYLGYTLPVLQNLARQHGIPYSGLVKGRLIDVLLEAEPRQAIQLDCDQLSILENWRQSQIIVAGPGAGKTTTVCGLTARIRHECPSARILLLSFNRAAQRILEERLRLFGIKPESKTNLKSLQGGCFALTFDKYVYHARMSGGEYSFDQGFRLGFEAALNVTPGEHERWDWLIVDECQDVQPNHAQLIDQLRPLAQRVVLAGDPRQELYPGADWFSMLCSRSQVVYLRYNHRSGVQVVDFLNRFSREHFPTLHHDQIPTRSESGSVQFDLVPTNSGVRVGEAILGHPVGQSYAITPITTSKFNNESVINQIRQTIYELKPGVGMTIMDDIDSNSHIGSKDRTYPSTGRDRTYLHPKSYFLGTSRKLKGSERRAVVVFQVDIPYTDYGVPQASLLKALFVAISRGRDSVQIILTRSPQPQDIFYKLVPGNIPVIQTIPTQLVIPNRVRVWDDLVKLDCWTVESQKAFDFPPVQVEVESDSDFVGLLTEAYVAGNLLQKITKFRTRIGDEPCGVFHLDDTSYEAVFSESLNLEQLKALNNRYKPEYAFALIKFSSQIGKIWTVSERLRLEPPQGTQVYSEIVRSWLVPDRIFHGKRLGFPILAHRSQIQVGRLVGEADFANSNGIIEMKHADPTKLHLIQSGLYATISSIPHTLLLNTKTGTSTIVRAFPREYVSNIARSFLALKHAQIHGIRLPFRQPRSSTSEVIISVDIETEGPLITEIGAWALGAGLEQIYGVYHQISEGVGPGESLTGLIVTDREKLEKDQKPMISEFSIWVQKISRVRTFLHWAGSEVRALSLDKLGNSIDVGGLFGIWLSQTGQDRRINRTLSDAVSQILGPIVFVPHRAFEDAVLTGAVYVAISASGGTL